MKNGHEVRGNTVAIFLRRKDGVETEALIDTSDFDRVCEASYWKACRVKKSDNYAVLGRFAGDRKVHRLHRFILDAPSGWLVDHINHDPLDNRRSNLRIVSIKVNNMNLSGARSNSRSGIRGVFWDEVNQRWRGRVKCGDLEFFDRFSSLDEAVKFVEYHQNQIMNELIKDSRHVYP